MVLVVKENMNVEAEIDRENVKALKETTSQIDERWSVIDPALKEIKDKYKRAAVAVLLENQKLMNDISVNSSRDGSLRSKLMDLVRKVYINLNAWNWVSIQPTLGPTGLIFYLTPNSSGDGLNVASDDIAARTRKFERYFADDFGVNDLGCDLIQEIDKEILTDLWNNPSKEGCVNLGAFSASDRDLELIKKIREMKKELSLVNFLVVNTAIYTEYRTAFDFLKGDFSIYSHDGVPGVLFGYKGESFMSSKYVYSPYVPFTSTPCYVGDAVNMTAAEKRGLLTRYGKKLLPGLGNYGRLTISNEKEEKK
jgi:hypothetical protein